MLGKQGPTPRSARRYSAHEEATKHCDLPKRLGRELRKHYQLPRDLPHQMFTLLIRLNDRVELEERPPTEKQPRLGERAAQIVRHSTRAGCKIAPHSETAVQSPHKHHEMIFLLPRNSELAICETPSARLPSLRTISKVARRRRIMASGGSPAFTPFTCPNCNALYQVVKVEAGPETDDREITCRACGGPLAGREGKFVLKYFLLRKGLRSRRRA